MNIMDMFGRQKATEQAAQQQQQAPHTTQNNPASAAPQPGQGPAPKTFEAPAGQPAKEVSPLDQFEGLWKNEPQNNGQEFDPSKLFSMDPAKMQEALGQVDFTKGISQEEMQAIQQGGEGAMAALASMLNKVSRETMQASMSVNAKMVEKAMTQAQGSINGLVDRQVKLHSVSSQLQEQNANVNHPAVAPMFNLLKTQLTAQYPTASAQEIATMATEYVTNMAAAVTGKKPEADTAPTSGVDWGAFYNS